jgi:hypothetical protein
MREAPMLPELWAGCHAGVACKLYNMVLHITCSPYMPCLPSLSTPTCPAGPWSSM